MGYNKSKRSIRRVEPYLKQMVEAEGEIKFTSEDPSKLAYDIRQGCNASKIYALDSDGKVEPYASYAALVAKYIVKVDRSFVVCEPRDIVFIGSPKQALAQVMIPDVVDVLGIIGAAIMHKGPVMIFPDASDETVCLGDGRDRLLNWAANNHYSVVIADNHVTLTRDG